MLSLLKINRIWSFWVTNPPPKRRVEDTKNSTESLWLTGQGPTYLLILQNRFLYVECDQMGKETLQYLAICSDENVPNGINNSPK